jgi:AraC-like DNA-binding protein
MRRFDDASDSAALWNLLEASVAGHRFDARIEGAVARLEGDRGGTRIAALASHSSMGLRNFQVRFLEQVGMAAKEFARVLRLQATIRQLDGGGTSLADVALDSGFADQSHATREIRQLTGLTPARLLSALRDQRGSEDTIRLAAAFVRGHARDGAPSGRPDHPINRDATAPAGPRGTR